MIPPLDVLKSLARLDSNSDFLAVVGWLRVEREAVIETLATATNPVLVHQAQGSLSTLTDITRSATTANAALGRIA